MKQKQHNYSGHSLPVKPMNEEAGRLLKSGGPQHKTKAKPPAINITGADLLTEPQQL
jgi:hypothetical protein